MTKEKPKQEISAKSLEIKKFSEKKDPTILNDKFAKDDELAFKKAKEEILFKDPRARVEIKKLSDGQKSAAILDSDGKTVFFTKWEDEVSELEKYKQK